MGDMNFPDPSQSPHESWEWDGEKWAKITEPGVPETTAIASGAMATGEMVVVNADGTVSVVTQTGATTNLTDSNYIGVSTGDYADGAEATVQIAGINDDQQGMTVGKQYILPDGSLTTDESSGGGDYEVGTSEVFNSNGNTTHISSTYDPVNNKVVIAYMDNGSPSGGNAIVVTVSVGLFSFGTPVLFNTGDTKDISCTYDSVANKVVIAYMDNGSPSGGGGTGIVGAVSGDSISFGTPVVFNNVYIQDISSTYDPVANRVVIAYRDSGNSDYGTAIVGVVSGDSITFGTPVVFNSKYTGWVSSTHDPVASKVVITYRDSGNSSYGTAVVGAVSGDLISFGTPVVFNNGNTTSISSAYDPVASRVVIAYRDNGNSGYGTAIVGNVSGDSITFGSPVVFNESLGNVSTTYDPVANKVVFAYMDSGNSNYGTAVVGTVSGDSIAFGTTEVFNNSGDTSVISSTYDSISNKVVIAYKDQCNSNYGTAVTYSAVGEPNVFAGTAISSTELNIKDTV